MASGHVEHRTSDPKRHMIVLDLGRDENGKRIRKYIPFRGSKKEAEKELGRLITEAEKGTYIDPTTITVSEYLKWWLEQHEKAKNLAPKTRESYKYLLETHLIPVLGQIPLAKLAPLHIQNYVNEKLDKLSARTVAYSVGILREALKHAVRKWRLIPLNPADAVETPSYKRVKYRALSAEEMQAFLKAAEGSSDYPVIYTALYTGMRRGELLGLRWENVDLTNGVLRIRQQLQRITGQGYITKAPKTEAGAREVALPASVVALLKHIKKDQPEARLRLGPAWQENGLVFCLEDGRPLDPSNFSRRFHKLATDAGFPDLRFHDLRHTHASLMLAAGEELTVVQQRLGHEKPTTTAAIYVHAIPGRQKEAADRFEELLRGSKKKARATIGRRFKDKAK